MKLVSTLYLSAMFLTLILSLSIDVRAEDICASLFSDQIRMYDLQKKDLIYREGKLGRLGNPTVETITQINDIDGTLLTVIKKTGETWDSAYTPSPANNQGDPRWFPILLGSKVGSFFGFKKISEDTITIPTAENLNLKIEKINKILINKKIEPITIRFHETGKEPEVQMDYLNQLLVNRSLPMATEGHYAIHDIAYHSLAILLPKKALDRLNTRIKLLIRLKGKIDNAKLTKFEKQVLVEMYEIRLQGMVHAIDFGTGNIAPILVWEKIGYMHSGRRYEAYDLKGSVMENLFTNTEKMFTGFEYQMEEKTSNLVIKYEKVKPELFEPGLPLEQKKIEIERSRQKLNKFAKEFLEENKNTIRSLNQKYTVEEFVNSIRASIRAIQENIN